MNFFSNLESRPTRLAADVHGLRHFQRTWALWAMAAAEAHVQLDADAANRTPRSLRYRRATTSAELPRHPTPPYRDGVR